MNIHFDPSKSYFAGNLSVALAVILEYLCHKAFLNCSDAPSYSELSFIPVSNKVYVYYGDVVVAYID